MPPSDILPWLAARDGRPLSPTGLGEGDYELRDLLSKLLKDYGKVLLWDVDGMEKGRPHLALYKRFEGKGLWVDEGVRSVGGLIDVLVAGAEIAVLNLKTFANLEELRAAGEMTEKLAVCVEETEGPLTRDPRSRNLRPADLFRKALQAGIDKGVYLRGTGLSEAPEWIDALEGLELYTGPAKLAKVEDQARWRPIVDAYELV